jgi:excisionase family DNA binding protein
MKNEQNPGLNPVLKNGQTDLPSKETIQSFLMPATADAEPLAYDINQAAVRLNTSTKTVRRLIIRGRLTCCKELRKILIPRDQIDSFFKRTCDKPNLNP